MINTNLIHGLTDGRSMTAAWTYTPALLPMIGMDAARVQGVQGTGASKLRGIAAATTFAAVNGSHPGTSVWSPPL